MNITSFTVSGSTNSISPLTSSPSSQVETEELEAEPQFKEEAKQQVTAPPTEQTNEPEVKDEKTEVANTQANTN